MKNNILAVSTLALVTALAAGGLTNAAQAAEENVTTTDPGRWFKADNTPQARYQNLQKEANAAYGEAILACKGKRGKELRSCRDEARAARHDDLQRAKRILKDYQASAPAS